MGIKLRGADCEAEGVGQGTQTCSDWIFIGAEARLIIIFLFKVTQSTILVQISVSANLFQYRQPSVFVTNFSVMQNMCI